MTITLVLLFLILLASAVLYGMYQRSVFIKNYKAENRKKMSVDNTVGKKKRKKAQTNSVVGVDNGVSNMRQGYDGDPRVFVQGSFH